MANIEIVRGDITQQRVDAIVNAANTKMLHGGGVAAAIVSAGGNAIQEESAAIAPIPLGEAAITGAGKLKVRFIIHAATMELGGLASKQSITSALASSFKRAAELGVTSIAFPALGAGIGGFSKKECAELSIDAALQYGGALKKIVFVLHDEDMLKQFQEAYRTLAGETSDNKEQ